jgi:hypothetical protein
LCRLRRAGGLVALRAVPCGAARGGKEKKIKIKIIFFFAQATPRSAARLPKINKKHKNCWRRIASYASFAPSLLRTICSHWLRLFIRCLHVMPLKSWWRRKPSPVLNGEALQISEMKSAEPCAQSVLLCAQRALIRTRCVDLKSFVHRDGCFGGTLSWSGAKLGRSAPSRSPSEEVCQARLSKLCYKMDIFRCMWEFASISMLIVIFVLVDVCMCIGASCIV